MITAAAVDMGSNTFRLLVAEFSGNTWRPLLKEMVTVRLGQGLVSGGLLQPEPMARGCAALAGFAEKMAACRPVSLRVCGTQALRVAANSGEFLARASALLQNEVEVLSGEEEARLTLLGILAALGHRLRYPLLLVDVGGGSSELLFQAAPGATTRQTSLPLGAVALSEEFAAATGAMADRIRGVLAPALQGICRGRQPALLVGSGGTATTLAALDLGLCLYEENRVHGHFLSRSRLFFLCDRLRALSPAGRADLPLLGHGRGEIIVAGAMIHEALMRLLDGAGVVISDAGLLEGILLSGKWPRENVE